MPCTLCEAMQRNMQTSKRHERLKQIGTTQRIARPGRMKAAWITQHVCSICETRWQHIDDMASPHAGWFIEKIAEECC